MFVLGVLPTECSKTREVIFIQEIILLGCISRYEEGWNHVVLNTAVSRVVSQFRRVVLMYNLGARYHVVRNFK